MEDAMAPSNAARVAAIVAECDASKTTFYNHFHDKYDLTAWYLEDVVSNALGGYDPKT